MRSSNFFKRLLKLDSAAFCCVGGWYKLVGGYERGSGEGWVVNRQWIGSGWHNNAGTFRASSFKRSFSRASAFSINWKSNEYVTYNHSSKHCINRSTMQGCNLKTIKLIFDYNHVSNSRYNDNPSHIYHNHANMPQPTGSPTSPTPTPTPASTTPPANEHYCRWA